MKTVPQAEDQRVMVGVRLPRFLDRAVERMAFDLSVSKQQVVEEALSARLLSHLLNSGILSAPLEGADTEVARVEARNQ